ncbi:MAG: hypothetical protein AAFN63_06545 [Pseudomonadota bacterium]
MADSYLERVAGELADLALADMMRSGDDRIVETVSEILGASSQTLQEAYLTAVRVRRAEARARELLEKRAGKIQIKGNVISDGHATVDAEAVAEDTSQMAEPGPEEPVVEEPQSEEDAAFADVLNTLDEFLQSEAPEGDGASKISPKKPTRG